MSDTSKVYSYIRFSTPEQMQGDSERRQLDEAEKWARDNGYELDRSLAVDRGRSAYHGVHLRHGALGEFLERVKGGEIAPGSVLLVESVDRISRQGFLDAFEVFATLIRKGVIIQTLSPTETRYDADSLQGNIYQLVGQLQGAHGESKQKSKRLKAAWQHKKEVDAKHGKVITRRAPLWLRVEDGEFKVIAEAATAIRRIFQMKAEGYGKGVITRHLNEGGYWKPPVRGNAKTKPGWRESYITKILTNRAVIGEYQPHKLIPYDKDQTRKTRQRKAVGDPISDYFPAVIKEDLFYTVQEQMRTNRNAGRRPVKAKNLFTGLIRCGYCGGSMHHINKGDSPKGGQYLVCDTGRRGVGCDRKHRVRYDETEDAILANCKRLRPEEVLPEPDAQARRCQELRQQVDGLTGKIAESQRRIENLTDAQAEADTKTHRHRLQKRIEAEELTCENFQKELTEAQRLLTEAQSARKIHAKWKQDFIALVKKLESGDADFRLRMREHLRGLIDKIEVFSHGCERNANATIEEIIGLEQELGVEPPDGFHSWVRDKLTSPEGRFLRVYFRRPGEAVRTAEAKGKRRPARAKMRPTGPYRGRRVVPAGALGMGMRGEKDEGSGPGALQEMLNRFSKHT
jgi:DNA invertase Pin-like site-specific DNA recombinase